MPEVDVLKISNEDAAFVLGKNGKTSECARPAPELQQMSAHTARLACERADTPAHSCVLRAFPSPPSRSVPVHPGCYSAFSDSMRCR